MGDITRLFYGQKTRFGVVFRTITILFLVVLQGKAQTTRFSIYNDSKELISCFDKTTFNDSVRWFSSYSAVSGNVYQLVETKKFVDATRYKLERSINSIYVRENDEDMDVQMKSIYLASPYRIEIEKWVYFYENDTVSKIEIHESGKCKQHRKIQFSKNLCEINYHNIDSAGNKGPSYAKDSIVISDGGATLDNYFLRWGETYKTRSEMTKRKRKIGYDEVPFSREVYHYNHWTINEHVLSVMAGEGPIVIFPQQVMNFEKQLTKKRKIKEEKEVRRSEIKVQGREKIYRMIEKHSGGEKYTTEVSYSE